MHRVLVKLRQLSIELIKGDVVTGPGPCMVLVKEMAKSQDRTLRIIWRQKGKEVFVDVFAPVILLNLRSVDLRLRKAGLCEIEPLIINANEWHSCKPAKEVFLKALDFFDRNPEAISFSDMLVENLPDVVAGFDAIPPRCKVRFEKNDLADVSRERAIESLNALLNDL